MELSSFELAEKGANLVGDLDFVEVTDPESLYGADRADEVRIDLSEHASAIDRAVFTLNLLWWATNGASGGQAKLLLTLWDEFQNPRRWYGAGDQMAGEIRGFHFSALVPPGVRYATLRRSSIGGDPSALAVDTIEIRPVTGYVSLQEVFAGGVMQRMGYSQDTWMGLVASPSLQHTCFRQGFNVAIDNTMDIVRIGISGSDDENCGNTGSLIGVGIHSTLVQDLLGPASVVTAGNAATAAGDHGPRATVVNARVWVR
jgi:hypothetical protein